jgi:hypothetical protein
MFEGLATVKINNLVNVSFLSSSDITRLNNSPEKEIMISIDNDNILKKYCEFSRRHYYYKYDSNQDIWVSDFEILKLISKKQNNKQEIKDVVQNVTIDSKPNNVKSDNKSDLKLNDNYNVISSPDLDNLLQSLNKPKISNTIGNDLLNSLSMDINKLSSTKQNNNPQPVVENKQNIQFQNIPNNQQNNVLPTNKKLSEMSKQERKKLLNRACNKCHKIHRVSNSKCT